MPPVHLDAPSYVRTPLHKYVNVITRIKYSSRSRIEMGGQDAECLVMALCLGPGGQRSCLVHIPIPKRCKIGARGAQGPWPWICY